MSEDGVNKVSAQLTSRVGRLERDVTALGANVESLTASVEKLNANVQHLSETVSQSTKADWKTLAAWASVVIAVVVYHGDLSLKPLDLSFRDITAEVKQLDEVLQREMRLLDATSEAKIEHLDKTLQREMRLLDESQNKEIEHIRLAVKLNAEHLSSRRGQRWNKPDQKEFEQRLNARLEKLEQGTFDRWTKTDHQHFLAQLDKRLRGIEAELKNRSGRIKANEVLIKEFREVQKNRTSKFKNGIPE